MTFIKVETPGIKITSKVSVKPYFDDSVENMGLENYGMTLHDGIYHTEQIVCLERNGIKRYVTGLNEFAPEIKLISDKKAKEAKIKEIRTVVAQLEQEFAANVVAIDDEDFWNKLKVMRPDNDEFWSKIELKASNATTFMDPAKDPYDLIKLYAIDAGGFSIVAPSYEAAKTMAIPPKFYLDRAEETVSAKNTVKKLRNKALAELQSMFDKDSRKLLYVAKVIDPGSVQYKFSTSNETLYDLMDSYITGASFEKSKMIAAQTFVDTSKMSVGDLKLRAVIKDAAYHKFISLKADGHIYHTDTSSVLGKNPSDVFEYLKNPLNEQVYVDIQDAVVAQWEK